MDALVMSDIANNSIAVAVVIAAIGGIVAAQWPRPSLLRRTRITGCALGAGAMAYVAALAVARGMVGDPAWDSLLIVGPVLVAGGWIFFAFLMDRLVGPRIFTDAYNRDPLIPPRFVRCKQ